MGASIGLLFLLFSFGQNVHAINCELKSYCSLQSSNKTLPPRESKGVKIPGGDFIGFRGSCAANCKLANRSRMESWLKDAKARLRHAVLGGRQEKDLSQVERDMLAPIQSAQLVDPANDKECRTWCDATNAASNHPKGNKICVCPGLEDMPLETIMLILGHELGHSGDICSSRTGIRRGAHPFELPAPGGSVLQCLEANGIPGEKAATQAQKKGDPGFFNSLLSPELPDPCQEGSLSVMTEASADVFGLMVLGDFLKDHPFARDEPQNLVRAFGLFMDIACNSTENDRTHANALDRIGKIFLSQPSIREAFHCRGHTPSLSCDYRPPSSANLAPADTAK